MAAIHAGDRRDDLGNSLAIKEMKKLIEMVCSSNTTVLIHGAAGKNSSLRRYIWRQEEEIFLLIVGNTL